MKFFVIASFIFIALSCCGCFQVDSDDHLSSVPVTNNPNLIPKSGQMAQGPGF